MSIKVTNTSPKVIGLGAVHVLQGDTVELPAGFGLENPTVAWLINRGWLTKVSTGGVHLPPSANGSDLTPPAPSNGENTPPETNVTPPVGDGGGNTQADGGSTDGDDTDGDPATGNTENDDAANNTPAGELSRSAANRMKIEELRELATQRGLEFAPDATKAVLVDLIMAAVESGGQE